jgi:hypothetical protein
MHGDLEGRQELGVEVARGEAEGAALVLLDDDADVPRTEPRHRPAHAGGTVVVGGDGQRPGARGLVVRPQQAGGGDRGEQGVAALVDHVVDPHEASARRAGELPDAGRAGVGVCGRVEGRLHVGEGGELLGYAPAVQDAADVVLPAPGAGHPGAELVGLAELEADASCRPGEGSVRDALREQPQHPGLLLREPAALARRELAEDGGVALLVLGDGSLARAAARARVADQLVDHVQVLGVVQQPAFGSDLAVDPDPEADPGLQGVGQREEVRRRHAREGALRAPRAGVGVRSR